MDRRDFVYIFLLACIVWAGFWGGHSKGYKTGWSDGVVFCHYGDKP